MIVGSFGPYTVVSARDHGNGAGHGLRAWRLGREQRLRFQGLAVRQSRHKNPPMCHRAGSAKVGPPARWFPAVPPTAGCPRASLVACLHKPGVRWSRLKCRGLIQVPVIVVNPLRSRAVPDNSCPARNGKRRPPPRCVAPIRPPLFLSHAMKGDRVFQPSQGTGPPEGRLREPKAGGARRPGRAALTRRPSAAPPSPRPPSAAPPGPRTAFRPRHPRPRPGLDTRHGPHRISPRFRKLSRINPHRKCLRFRLPPPPDRH
jgi:hypothetical protein